MRFLLRSNSATVKPSSSHNKMEEEMGQECGGKEQKNLTQKIQHDQEGGFLANFSAPLPLYIPSTQGKKIACLDDS